MKNLGTIALTVLMFTFFISGCGDDGVDGITGTAGCDFDQVRDADTGLCVHDQTGHEANHPKDGDPGDNGVQCDVGRVWSGFNGKCVAS
jgi:hypothetical protein